MKSRRLTVVAALTFSVGLVFFSTMQGRAQSQPGSTPAYLNPSLPAVVRARDLVSRMTLEEKASQMVNEARAIPRLKVPAYNWWSEALHGVAVNGTTEFPEPIGLGATFDVPAIHQMAIAISEEGRAVYEENVHDGNSIIFHGLDFWAPNINIFRDPRWGRGQETYGEDPFLTSRMGVAYITGMQGDNSKYFRVIATPKHFDAYSGPEPTRHFADVDVSLHDWLDTYQPAFRAAIVQGHADSIMCSYNAVNGVPSCANSYLLQKQLRENWGFQGYVVSDCAAVHDIFSGHHYRPTLAQAAAIAVEHGMDNECIDFTGVKGDEDYKPYIEAVQEGYLSMQALDQALVRLFTARIKLGLFDPQGMDPYADTPTSELNSPAHRNLARKLADESMVLLKNNGILPLKPGSVHSIAVVGPLADQTGVLLGNYSGIPTHTVTVLEGLKAEYPNTKITYVPGTQFLSDQASPVPSSLLTTPDGKPGLLASYIKWNLGMITGGNHVKLITSRLEPNVNLNASNMPAQMVGQKSVGVNWRGYITPNVSGHFLLGVRADGYATVKFNDRTILMQYLTNRPEIKLGYVDLQKGVRVPIEVSYGARLAKAPVAQLVWARVNNQPSPAAIAAAKKSDVVIAVVGLTSQLEGEEMPVDQPGFLGGDRTNLQMPGPEEALVQAMVATGKPVIVVLTNGSALAVNWINQHASAILESWYAGEEGGAAIADTISGKNDPAGRLPVTFYANVNQLPNFENYSMANRTYRYFTGKPLYPFGYGLSYTTFRFSDLKIAHALVAAGDPVEASATVTNTGRVAGDEVVQLYLKFPPVAGAPQIALRGFTRIHLNPGQSQQVHFLLDKRNLSMVTTLGQIIIAEGNYTLSIGGGQPNTVAPVVIGHFHVNGQIGLSN